MKVICIDEKAWPENYRMSDKDKIDTILSTGSEYNVIGIYKIDGFIWYVLAEDGPHWGYWEKCFAPLSNIDETEFKRQKTVSSEKNYLHH